MSRLNEFQEMHHFLSSQKNVFLNFGAVENAAAPALEQVYLYNIIRELQKWPRFNDFRFYLVTANAPHDFLFDNSCVVFYLSNEDHQIPENILKAKLVCSPYCPTSGAAANCLPIPLGYNGSVESLPYKPVDERPFYIFFSGNLHRRRLWFFFHARFYLLLNSVKSFFSNSGVIDKIQFTRKFTGGLSPTEYAQVLMDSKIACVPEGYKSDISFRFFEAAKSGNVIITKTLYDFWFFKDFPGIQLSSWRKLHRTLRWLDTNPSKLKEISQRMLNYYETKCAEPAVAQKVIEVLMFGKK